MFGRKKRAKAEEKQLEFYITLIEKLGTCETRIMDLYEQIDNLKIELQKHIDGGHN